MYRYNHYFFILSREKSNNVCTIKLPSSSISFFINCYIVYIIYLYYEMRKKHLGLTQKRLRETAWNIWLRLELHDAGADDSRDSLKIVSNKNWGLWYSIIYWYIYEYIDNDYIFVSYLFFYFLLSVFMSCRLALKYLPNLAVTVKYFQTSCAKYSAAAAAYDRKHLWCTI